MVTFLLLYTSNGSLNTLQLIPNSKTVSLC